MTTTAADEWGAVATAWDASADYVDAHSSEATDALVRAAAVQPGDRVLELGAGPGTLGPIWSRAVEPGGRVVVSDVAPAMVEVAASRNRGFANVETAVVDASSIEYPDASFDVVVSRMGLMFVPEPTRAFGEIHRVLAPGGRFAALTWAALEHNPWMTCVGMAAMMNGLVAGPPPFAPGGIFSLGDPAQLEAITAGAGFESVAVEAVDVCFESDSLTAHIARVSSLAAPLAAAFAAADADQLAAVRRTAADLAADHTKPDGTLSLPGRALLVHARAGSQR
ncbi:MAG TPA: methyltransferase domain-containing protein [Acidimicrobiales bacterium]|jgi:SAM-dependent methyltransferase|nr:methyltransferase domain-containing protein [Acidimicrobiales bacterium]